MLYIRVIQYFLICFFSINIIGCKNTKNIIYESKNNDYIYGQGYGSSFEVAKQHAIQDLTTNLKVSIKYSLSNTIQENNNTLKTSGVSNILFESHIKDLPFIEIDQTNKDGNKVFVRIKIKQSMLRDDIYNRIQTKQQKLSSIIIQCDTPSFKQYKSFKALLNDLRSDISLYQILSGNMSYGNSILTNFQDSIATMPKYIVSWDSNLINNRDIKDIIILELSKFIKIDKVANRILNINIVNDETMKILLKFYDCSKNIENIIQIDTYMQINHIGANKLKSRLGAIIYKAIDENY